MNKKHTNHQDGHYTAPLEPAFARIVTPFEQFIHHETTSGIMLMVCTVAALLLANSPFAENYLHIIHSHISVQVGDWILDKSVHHWINDGLMALFFFVVGLEIKREILVGELARPRQAALPILAALGGMLIPALIFYLINPQLPDARGWGIPMATDIAFAVAALVLLGPRIPRALIMFLVALAIVDDLGAVVVIALFYTEQIALSSLGLAAFMLVLLALFNLGGVRAPAAYFLVGILLWFCMLQSGIHATLAGVLLAFTIPARPKYDPPRFTARMRGLLDRFETAHQRDTNILTNGDLLSLAQTLARDAHLVETPLQRMETSWHLPVALLVIPLFALANAGIPLHLESLGATLSHPVTLGAGAGLVLGKFIGITGASWLALRLGIGQLPSGTTLAQIAGVALLGGIGFTMSIFIAELAYIAHPDLLIMAKTGILAASLCSGALGYLWLLSVTRRPEQ